jgi:cation diffusion facilitator family transporter
VAGNSTKAIVAAFFANAGIAVAKFVGFFITGSSSMLAESVHSVADSGNQGLLLLGHRLSKREATVAHPFGYGRERYFWSFVVALVLFSLGGAFATFEGIEKIRHPHQLESINVAIGILVFGLFLEGWSFRTAIIEARPLKGDRSWWTFIRRSRNPELPVVVMEDFGALIGLCLALIGVGMSEITGDPVWDGVGTLCIGLLLGVIAVVLAIEMKSLLIGEGASVDDRADIVAAIDASAGGRSLIHMRTQHIGPDDLLVAAKIEFDPGLDTADLAAAVDEVEAEIRTRVPTATRIYLEPDLRRDQGDAEPG